MCLEPKKTETEPTTTPTTPFKGVELIDGHKYRTKGGEIVTLNREPSNDSWVRQMAKDYKWGPGSDKAVSYNTTPKGFWYADFQKGLPGVYTEKETMGMDSTLVEDVTEPAIVPAAAPTKGFPLRLPLVEGRRYVRRDGEVVTAEASARWQKDGLLVRRFGEWGDRLNHVATGKHYYSNPDFDIVAEADAYEGAPAQAPEGFTLTLTKDEAETLRVVCWLIGGSPGASPRGFMDEIDNKLLRASVERKVLKTSGTIHFPDTPKPEPVKPVFVMNPDGSSSIKSNVYKTRKGTLVIGVYGGSHSSKKRTWTVQTLDGQSTQYKVHLTGEAHDDKSTCPDDILEVVHIS